MEPPCWDVLLGESEVELGTGEALHDRHGARAGGASLLWQSQRFARGCRAEQGSVTRKSGTAFAVSEQAEMADANEAAGKHMQQEAAQKLMS